MSKKRNVTTGSEFFEMVADTVGIKKKVVRDVVYALSDTSVTLLKKEGEIRIPRIGKLTLKSVAARSRKAGEYPDPFQGGKMVFREAKKWPAMKKVKFSIAGQIKKPFKK